MKRYELKFIMTEEMLSEFKHFVGINGFLNSYPDRKVNSLYFDNYTFDGINDNLSGISNRKKVRLRWYPENKVFTNPILEIKKRNGRVGGKDKFILKNMSTKELDYENSGEIKRRVFDNLKNNHSNTFLYSEYYHPILLVNYNREYLHKKGIRITLDSNINFRNIVSYKNINYFKERKYENYILEIKFPLEMKREVSELIRKLNLSPQRHSKYLIGTSILGYSLYL